jgi:hypothetical protein
MDTLQTTHESTGRVGRFGTTHRVVPGLLVGFIGGLLTLYVPLGIIDFSPWLVLAGIVGAVVGRGGMGLVAVLGGAAAGAALGLVGWALLDLSGARYIPLAVVILGYTIPLLVGGSYLIARGVIRIADRLRS